MFREAPGVNVGGGYAGGVECAIVSELPLEHRFVGELKEILADARRKASTRGRLEPAEADLLLALLVRPDTVGGHVLRECCRDPSALELVLEEASASAAATQAADACVEAATLADLTSSSAAWARRLGHNYIGSEHLLLAIAERRSPKLTDRLAALGITLDSVRAGVVELLGSVRQGGASDAELRGAAVQLNLRDFPQRYRNDKTLCEILEMLGFIRSDGTLEIAAWEPPAPPRATDAGNPREYLYTWIMSRLDALAEMARAWEAKHGRRQDESLES